MKGQPSSIRDWLVHQSAGDIPLYRIARALGVSPQKAEKLLQAAPTAEALLNLNRLAQYRHLALANRVWPNCTWLAWETRHSQEHPTIDLIRRVFGRQLLEYVSRTFGQEVVRQYWMALAVPPEYDDISLADEDLEPVLNVPEEQIVDNPHCDLEEDGGEFFVFGAAATAACFRWLIGSRSNYSHYVYNLTGYTNDPIGVQLAYDLRRVLKEEYWASLPPDTLPAYLAIARALQVARVPEEYEEGRLAPLHTSQIATLPTDRLEVLQTDDRQLWLFGPDALDFDRQPVHVFVLEPDSDEAPAALILTTHDEPGNPEQHLENPPLRYLHRSQDTMLLAFVPRDQAEDVRRDISEYEDVLYDTLVDTHHGLDGGTGIFCVCRFNPSMSAGFDEPIPVYRIPGGYMLQFNPEYRFAPDEMAVE